MMLSVMLVALIGPNILVFDDEVGRRKKTKRTCDPMDSTSVNAMEERLKVSDEVRRENCWIFDKNFWEYCRVLAYAYFGSRVVTTHWENKRAKRSSAQAFKRGCWAFRKVKERIDRSMAWRSADAVDKSGGM